MNKKLLIYLSPFALLMLLLVGCGGPSASDTVEEFMTAMNFGDYERARELASSDSQGAIDWAESFGSFRENDKYESFEITGEDINGDYGKVYYMLEGDSEEHYLKVKRSHEGDWLVMFSKADLGDGREMDTDGDIDLGDVMGGGTPFFKKKNKERGAYGDADEVAEQFLLAMAYGDYEKAKGLASQQSQTALDLVAGSSPGGAGPEDFEITDVDKKGNYATVFYREEGSNQTKELKMRKEPSGKWVVIFQKSDVNDNEVDLDLELDEELDVNLDWDVDIDVKTKSQREKGAL